MRKPYAIWYEKQIAGEWGVHPTVDQDGLATQINFGRLGITIPVRLSRWTLLEMVEGPLCRTIGCSSWFAHRWEWPHRYVCVPMTNHYIPKGVRERLVSRETHTQGEQ